MAYIEQLTAVLAPVSVKQHLAALRMLFDWLVVGQVLPFNPASSVRGPKQGSSQGLCVGLLQGPNWPSGTPRRLIRGR